MRAESVVPVRFDACRAQTWTDVRFADSRTNVRGRYEDMKKFALSAFVIIVFGLYVLYTTFHSSVYVPIPAVTSSRGTRGGNAATSAVAETQPAPVSNASNGNGGSSSGAGGMMGGQGNEMMSGGMMGAYRDGSYTGNAADAYYGTVQVRATIQGGKVSNIEFLQYPSDRGTSVYINGIAMPQLIQEAIAAQSAQVDGVSGATATSEAFMQSLASALAQAKN